MLESELLSYSRHESPSQRLPANDTRQDDLIYAGTSSLPLLLQSYGLYMTGIGQSLELDSCLQLIGESSHVTSEQVQNLMSDAATPHERVVLSLVQDGKEMGTLGYL